MRRRSLGLTLAAGATVFLVILVLYLPASWVAGALPAGVRCGELGGSVWHGECLGLKYADVALGDATWNLGIGSAITGRLVGDVDLRGSAFNARAEVDASFRGNGVLRNVHGNLNLDPGLVAQLPADKRGTVIVNLGKLEVIDGAPRAIEGTIEVRDFRQVGARPFELGSYQATFDGNSPAEGSLIGKLRDLGGPFAVEGTITLTPPRNYLVQGFITGRTADSERLVRREIALGAMPDAAGRSEFSFEGSY
jgi:hypothetical protein